MPNNFQKVTWVTMESLRRLVNKLEVSRYFNTDLSREFTKAFAVGDTIYPKLPQRYLIRDGLLYTPQSIDRKTTSVKLDQVFGVDFDYDSVEKALEMERGEDIVKREYIEPAMDQIAQEIDSRAAWWATYHCPNDVGSLGVTPVTLAPYHLARQRLVEYGCPPGEWGMIVSPAMHSTLAGTAAIAQMFNPVKDISRLWQSGLIGNLAGFNWHESVSLYDHTCGTDALADLTVNANVADGATSVSLISAAGGDIHQGDIISFTTPMACNPGTRRSLGHAKTFVVGEQHTFVAATPQTVNVSPAIYGPGSQYQNISALPVATDTVRLFPQTAAPTGLHGIQGLALSRDAFAMVSVKMEEPKAVEVASTMRDPKTGIAISFVRQFEGRTRTMINRFDVLLGFGDLYPENCSVRVQSLI